MSDDAADDELLPSSPSDVTDGWFAAVADRVAAAASAGDTAQLRDVLAFLRRAGAQLASVDPAERVGPVTGLRAVAEIVARLLDSLTMTSPARTGDSEWARMLDYLGVHEGATNTQVAAGTGLDFTQVSRAGRRLAAEGLANPAKAGRINAWTVTPRGHALLNGLGAADPAHGDVPAAPARRGRQRSDSGASRSGSGTAAPRTGTYRQSGGKAASAASSTLSQSRNSRDTTSRVASAAARTLTNPKASKAARSAAASTLSQTSKDRTNRKSGQKGKK